MIETPERTRLTPIICEGRLKDGRPCKKVRLDARLAPGSVINWRCDRCKTVNQREV